MCKIWKSDKNVSSFGFSLDYTFWWLLTEAYLEPGRTSTMEFFFAKILNRFKLLTIFAEKAPSPMFGWVENSLLAKDLKY